MLHALLPFIGDLIVPTAHAIQANEFCNLYGQQLAGGCGFGLGFFVAVAENIRLMALGLVPSACVIAVIIGGIRIMSSGIDDGGREQGKTIIKFALIGLVLSVSVGLVLNFVAGYIMNNILD